MADGRRRDLLALTAIAVALRLPAILSSRHLSFDDGVYGQTAVAMRHGARPYHDIFSSQGPLHDPLIYLADLAGFRTANAPRLLSLASGVAIALCVYLVARRMADRRAGWVAAVLATTSGSVLLVTTGISGDGPAIAFAVGAVTVAFSYRDHPTTSRALAAGLLIGATCAVKLLAAPVVIPVGLLLLSRRRTRDVVGAALLAVAVPILAAAPWGYARVWDQSVRYHREARRYTYAEAVWRVVATLVERDTFVVATVLVVLVLALGQRARWTSPSTPAVWRPGTAFGAWFAVQLGFLFLESAMWRPHVSELVVPLCLLAALRLPSLKVLVVPWLVAAPLALVNTVGFVRPGGYRSRSDRELSTQLRRLPRSAVVVSDDPGYPWRAGLRVPDGFVDTSVKQFDQHRITESDVLRAARSGDACAVLVTSHERLGRFTDLPARLAPDGYRTVLRLPDGRLLVRPCAQ